MTHTNCIILVVRYLNPHLKQMKIAVAYILQSDTSVYVYFTVIRHRGTVNFKDNNRSDEPEALGYFLPCLFVDFSPGSLPQTVHC